MIESAQSGNFESGSTWVGGVAPNDTDDYQINAGHVVTISASVTHQGTGTIYGTLLVDGGGNGINVYPGTLYIFKGATLHVAANAGLTFVDGGAIYLTGTLILDGVLVPDAGASCALYILPVSPFDLAQDAPATVAITNPQNCAFPRIADGIQLFLGAPVDPGLLPEDGIPLRLKFTATPSLTISSANDLDLNTVAPGESLSDYAFSWDWTTEQGLPMVYPLIDGQICTEEVSLKRITDQQWAWSFTVPEDASEGGRAMVVAAHGEISGYAAQYMRAQIRTAWATDASLAAAHGPGAWGSNLLVNGRTVAVAVTTATPTAVSGVEIVLTSDAAGENVVTGTFVTDGSGVATFKATPGSYYLWRRKASYTFGTNPRTLTVTSGSGTQSVTYADAAVQTGTIPAAADVRAGTPVGSSTGTLDLPTTDKVQYGVQYDAGSKTGTFASQGFIVYASPLNADGSVFTIIQGDAYDISEARPLSWSDPGWWPNLATATHVYLNIRDAADALQLTEFACTVAPASGDAPQKVLAKPTHTQTHAMPPGEGYTFDLQALFSDGGPVTLIEGTGSVILPVRRSS